MLFGDVPRLQELKVFGSAFYPYIKPYNENKLQPRVVLYVFLGYAHGYKGVMCYHPQTRKFIISRHVIHNEDVFPCKISSAICKDQSQDMSYTQEATNHRSSAIFVLPVHSPNANIISNIVNISPSNEVQLSGSESTIPVVQSHFQGLSTTFDSSTSSPQSETTLLAPQTASVLHVLHPAQLEVILPFETSNIGNASHCDTHTHKMQTKLQTGAISRKDYSSYIASWPELSTLRLDDIDTCQNGFSFMAHINDIVEPTSFRSAATNTGRMQCKRSMMHLGVKVLGI
ncbi:hypothetical protein ACFX1Q_040675 [Malus domestica]